MTSSTVIVERAGRTTVITLNRPERRNAIDAATAALLRDAFVAFDADGESDVAVLTGAGGAFCAGADLQAMAQGEWRPVTAEGDLAPMGPSRMRLSKPSIAAIEGPAVAGGLELALLCDLRIAGGGAYFGVLNRRFGVPLIDLGTVRLPRLIGHARALDLILTGRVVDAAEALAFGLVTRVVETGTALDAARALAEQLSAFPQAAMRNDRLSAYEQWDLSEADAARNEIEHGLATIASGEAFTGAARFAAGVGRHGRT
jgi:enoyl-CoA hydratase